MTVRRAEGTLTQIGVKVSDAESLTGITQQQVSKWAKKLQKPEQYRAQLFGAANYNRERNSTAAT